MQTQNDRLLNYLERNGDINPMQAWQELGIYRLGARIFDLKESGVKIDKTTTKVCNRFGEACRVAKYRLVKQEAAQ